MTYPKTESWRDDFDLEPNTHPTIAYALQHMRTAYAAQLANERLAASRQAVASRQVWPFPTQPIPPDRKTPPPRHADAEEAPL